MSWHENITNDPYEEYRPTPKGCRDVIIAVLVWIALCLFCVFGVGCKSQQQSPVPVETITDHEHKETEVPRDTVIVTQADSAAILARLKCDSTNNVLLEQLAAVQGDRIKPNIDIKRNDDGSVDIKFECKEDSLRHEIELRDKIIEDYKKEKHTEVIVQKVVPDYYKNTSAGFWVLLVILLAVIGLKFGKYIIKTKTGGIL